MSGFFFVFFASAEHPHRVRSSVFRPHPSKVPLRNWRVRSIVLHLALLGSRIYSAQTSLKRRHTENERERMSERERNEPARCDRCAVSRSADRIRTRNTIFCSFKMKRPFPDCMRSISRHSDEWALEHFRCIDVVMRFLPSSSILAYFIFVFHFISSGTCNNSLSSVLSLSLPIYLCTISKHLYFESDPSVRSAPKRRRSRKRKRAIRLSFSVFGRFECSVDARSPHT